MKKLTDASSKIWPINKQKSKSVGRVNAGGANRANALIRRLDREQQEKQHDHHIVEWDEGGPGGATH